MADRNGATRRIVVLGAGAACLPTTVFAAEPVVQPAEPTPQAFMSRALAMRRLAESRGDQPYGAAVVLDDVVISERPSAVVAANDATAHAEMEAIRDALRRLAGRSLAGAVLYSSSRPCAMCEAAAARAGVARMIHGERLADAGPPQARR